MRLISWTLRSGSEHFISEYLGEIDVIFEVKLGDETLDHMGSFDVYKEK